MSLLFKDLSYYLEFDEEQTVSIGETSDNDGKFFKAVSNDTWTPRKQMAQ